MAQFDGFLVRNDFWNNFLWSKQAGNVLPVEECSAVGTEEAETEKAGTGAEAGFEVIACSKRTSTAHLFAFLERSAAFWSRWGGAGLLK